MQTGTETIPDLELDELTMLIVLTCRDCDADVVVSTETRHFRELGVGPRVAYYGLDGRGRPKLAGISDGRAETFECLACHSREWARRNSYVE